MWKARLHKDLFHFLTADKAVKVDVRFEEDVVVASSVCRWHYPVHRVLMTHKGGGGGVIGSL